MLSKYCVYTNLKTLYFFAKLTCVRTVKEFFSCRLRNITGIFVYGEPEVSVVGFGSDDFDIFALGNELTDKGWNLNSLQYPSG